MRVQLSRHLLDRQIVAADGVLVGKVDDVELGVGPDGVPAVRALLTGQAALGRRIGGPAGRVLAALAGWFVAAPPAVPRRIPIHLVGAVDSAVRLTVRADRIPPPPVEDWLRRTVVGRIPGAGRASG